MHGQLDLEEFNEQLGMDFYYWNKESKLGYIFDSPTGFKLPNNSIRFPNISWVAKERWEAIPKTNREVLIPICPDFVVEIRGEKDKLETLKEQMQEYILNGTRLAWLIDRQTEQAYIYTPQNTENQDLHIVEESYDFSQRLSGRDVIPNFYMILEYI